MSATLGDDASVKTFTHRILVECKDIDEVTTKEEVYNAIKSLPGLEGIESSDITGLRPAYAGTQTATISLPAPKAKKLIQLGKVKVGWVNCRIRERVQLKNALNAFSMATCPVIAVAHLTGRISAESVALRGTSLKIVKIIHSVFCVERKRERT